MINLKQIHNMRTIKEITDGVVNMTHRKFGDIILAQLTRILPTSCEITPWQTLDYFDDNRMTRAKTQNSSLGAWYRLDYNDKDRHTFLD